MSALQTFIECMQSEDGNVFKTYLQENPAFKIPKADSASLMTPAPNEVMIGKVVKNRHGDRIVKIRRMMMDFFRYKERSVSSDDEKDMELDTGRSRAENVKERQLSDVGTDFSKTEDGSDKD